MLLGTAACADPCLDDGIFQDQQVDCQAVPGSTSGNTGSESTGTAPMESCFNGVQDSDETAVDCGGICEAACAIGEGCLEPEDCQTSLCGEDQTCRAPASCDDGAKDDGESDQDCGGVCGSTCPVDADCEHFTDCDSLVCEDGSCAAPSCSDGAPNGHETDVDCGGTDCAPCATGGGCIQDTDCLTNACDAQGICVAPHCTNGAQDAEETDIDCGGPGCAPCAGGEGCSQNDDCASAVCEAGTCTTASCDDGVRNGEETDIDCGGAVCDACVDGQGCEDGGDCASESCDPVHQVCEAASCSNGILDGTETDIDCGGPSCAPCGDGDSCGEDSDCTSNSCTGATCESASCDDGVRNGTESDVDCGGDTCSPCDDGETCVLLSDCTSQVCLLEECQPPGCGDGVQNGTETDLDCGGECGSTCETDEVCNDDEDCISRVCDDDTGTCSAPTCSDGARNGNETDIDCGGPSCEPCEAPGMCVLDSDCVSDVCNAGTCAPASCRDGVHNGTETDIDCGGDACGPCDDGESCEAAADCISDVCTGGSCIAATCDDGVQNGTETDIDCGGDTCDPCDDGDSCGVAADCVSLVCDPVAMTCESAQCNDGVQNGTETDVDCGGDACSGCDTNETCNDDDDCTSLVCDGGLGSCSAPACDDGVQNGGESDIDCGGDTCTPCGDGETCDASTDCTSMVCLGGQCQPSACDDGVQNGTETDVDCGGSCQPCDDGETCDLATDCLSAVCDAPSNTCSPATCDDGVQNQGESDNDCGGPNCTPCSDGEDCHAASDCVSGVCDAVTDICSAPTCSDGVRNGDETDTDCGASCGASCDTGDSCDGFGDCLSAVCDVVTNTCSAPTCSDGVQNGSETDNDCGGSCGATCDTGDSCDGSGDCVSAICDGVTDTCSAPSCSDGVRNGDETDTDCGGSCGATCDTGEICDGSEDCVSAVCDAITNTCSAPSCSDGVQNGNETDIDCGGATCATCDDGENCNLASDCSSGICDGVSQTCTAPSCADGITNGDETDVDCGGSCGATCGTGDGCSDATDCSSAGCDGGACNAPLNVVITPNACGDAAGGAVSYTAVASGGTGGPYTYQWTPDDGTVDAPTAASVSIAPPDYASYTVTADDGVNTDTAVGVVVLSNQAFNLQNNCTLYQGTLLSNTPLASISYSAGGTVATEAGNNDLGLHLCEGVAFANTRLSGSFAVNTTSDDDFAGFVWGAQDSSHFYILSWKQAAQNFFDCSGGNSPEGIMIKRVFAPDFASLTGADLYCPNDTPNSEYLMTPGETLAAGWADNTPYTIEIDFTTMSGSTVRVTNDATASLLATFDVTDTTYQDGFFGSHTISQQAVSVGPLVGTCL